MMRSNLLVVATAVLGLALLGPPAWADDFSFSFGYSSGSWWFPEYSRSYVYYDAAPVIYRDCEPDIVVYERAPQVVYREYRRPAVVYRDCTPRVYYRDRAPRTVVYRHSEPRYYRTTKTYYRTHHRTYHPRPCYTPSYRAHYSPRHYSASPRHYNASPRRYGGSPRHHAAIRGRR